MRRLPVACLLVLLVLPVAPAAARERSVYHSRHLWSTVNVCDTKRHPDAIGIRASMPGSGRQGETMWMRFQVQYLSARDGKWHNFTVKGADSGFVKVGRHARYKARQAGHIFPFSPRRGERYVLRGAVTFAWRKRGKVVRRARKSTTAGHNVTIADPEGYSRKQCVIKGKPARTTADRS
jgi:hypothetical protein